jgi:hypothetical protein
MSIKIINFNNKTKDDIERSKNPGKVRKLPINRPKIDIENILNKIGSSSQDKKVLFNDVVEIAQYEKPPEIVKSISPLISNKKSIIEHLEKPNRTPSPNRKQREITEYFKKEIENLDIKLGKRTRSPSPLRSSSPVKNFYKLQEKSNISPVKKLRQKTIKVKLDKNWFKIRDNLIIDNYIEKLNLKSQISRVPIEDLMIFRNVMGYKF